MAVVVCREPLKPDYWEHPDVKAFLLEHSDRFNMIYERKWQEDYEKADPWTQMLMLTTRLYIRNLFSDGLRILAKSDG